MEDGEGKERKIFKDKDWRRKQAFANGIGQTSWRWTGKGVKNGGLRIKMCYVNVPISHNGYVHVQILHYALQAYTNENI